MKGKKDIIKWLLITAIILVIVGYLEHNSKQAYLAYSSIEGFEYSFNNELFIKYWDTEHFLDKLQLYGMSYYLAMYLITSVVIAKMDESHKFALQIDKVINYIFSLSIALIIVLFIYFYTQNLEYPSSLRTYYVIGLVQATFYPLIVSLFLFSILKRRYDSPSINQNS